MNPPSPDAMHTLLARQLKKAAVDPALLSSEWRDFLAAVNEAYGEFDADREMLERSLELSSQELLQANSEMRALLHAFPDLFFRVDRDGVILDVKAGAATDPFLPVTKYRGKRIQDVPFRDLGLRFQAAIDRVRATRSTESLEYELPNEDRREWFEARLLPLPQDQVIVIVRNITERKLAEEQLAQARDELEIRVRDRTEELSRANASLQESEEIFRSITGAAQDGILMMDDRGRVTYWNPAAERILGYSRREIIGQPLHGTLAPERYHDAFRQGLASWRATGDGAVIGRTVELVAQRKDGVEIEIELSISTVQLGEQWRAIGILRDVTARRETERALREAERRLRLTAEDALRRIEARLARLIDDMQEGAIIVDLHGRLQTANRAAGELLGYADAEELIGRRAPFPLWPGADDWGWLAARLDRDEAVREHEIHFRRRDGAARIAACSLRLVRDAAGRPAGVEGLFRDITERREAERRLLQAEKLAALGELVAGVAHEINNPNCFIALNIPVLRAYWAAVAPVLERSPAADRPWLGMPLAEFETEWGKLLDDMERGSQRITRIVNELKSYVRSGDNPKPEATPLAAIVESALVLIGSEVRRLVRRVEVTIEPDLPPVWANGGQIERVLVNLLMNAAYAADKDDSFIQIAARRASGPDDALELVVVDNGRGIAAENLERIFHPFFTTRQAAGGTGLGLAICRKIVAEHGGDLLVESAPGQGARFTVRLPATPPAGGSPSASSGS